MYSLQIVKSSREHKCESIAYAQAIDGQLARSMHAKFKDLPWELWAVYAKPGICGTVFGGVWHNTPVMKREA